MTSPILVQPNIKAGTCPHGLPQNSCPICSKQNMSGGSGMNSVKHSRPSTSNEWSYQKCYTVGMQIKAAHQHKIDTQNFWNKQFINALQLSKNIQNISDKINQFVQNIQSPYMRALTSFVVNFSVLPVLKFVDKISELGQKTINLINSAGEKIVSIIGEIKSFIQYKIIDNFKKKAKKFLLFCLSAIEDENYRNDETLSIFKARELRKYIVKILKINNKNEHRNSQ